MTKEYFTVDEAAAFLKTTKKYIYKMVFDRKLPCYKPTGGRLYFDPDELEKFIRNGRKATRAELQDRATGLLNSKRR
ncbi:MAG: helix-turn-helix domain-containing protein [Rectinema sp.]|jgi:excisionase family DNA binding protein